MTCSSTAAVEAPRALTHCRALVMDVVDRVGSSVVRRLVAEGAQVLFSSPDGGWATRTVLRVRGLGLDVEHLSSALHAKELMRAGGNPLGGLDVLVLPMRPGAGRVGTRSMRDLVRAAHAGAPRRALTVIAPEIARFRSSPMGHLAGVRLVGLDQVGLADASSSPDECAAAVVAIAAGYGPLSNGREQSSP